VKRFRGGLVFKAHRLVYHSTLGSRVIKKKKDLGWRVTKNSRLESNKEEKEGLVVGVPSFRGGLVFKARRLWYSRLESNKKEAVPSSAASFSRWPTTSIRSHSRGCLLVATCGKTGQIPVKYDRSNDGQIPVESARPVKPRSNSVR